MLHILKLLLPALIPSWNFFDVIAASPRIEYAQLQSLDETAIEWRAFQPRPDRVSFTAMLASLVWNARWNEALYVVSCAERLMAEPTAHSEDEIFRRIAAHLADSLQARRGWLSFQIVMICEHDGMITRDVAFVSDPRSIQTISVK
jgi:hypothetical protein